MPPPAADSLAIFHPVIREWFRESVGEPTEIQRLAWPEIARGEHVLVTAPTGSGKTLTAFLWALDRLLTGAWEGGRLRALYVSPLKALNNDVRRNLLRPLAELESAFAATGEPAAGVRVATRSGDTPSAERQRMIRRPPEILITTPESLNILLTSKGGRSILDGLRTVILDEIHAVAPSKRGTHLITAVERLTRLSGEFQRVALSATIRPRKRIAEFVGGYRLVSRPGEEPRYWRRSVQVLAATERKAYDLRVMRPQAGVAGASQSATAAADDPLPAEDTEPGTWDRLVPEFQRVIHANRSTLFFANSRRLTEKVTRLLNAGEPGEIVYSHHGSLSREVRAVVEERLKEGRLPAIVATNSLELGIDVGALDEVVLVQTPPTIASAVQRIGRAGHGVGETSRARLFPIFPRDFLDAAVVSRTVIEQDIEEVSPIRNPLDVLAQVLLSMAAAEPRRIDDLYDEIRASYPYRDLPRKQFDLVLEMLAGRYADSRVRELDPRLAIDRVDGTVRARRGATRLLYLSGGTIPDRGYLHLRLADTRARLGELDEEFVWERSLGDTFTLGAQDWRIQKITHNDVLVTPARRSAGMAPFWRAEERNRSFHLSERIGLFLQRAEETLVAGKEGTKLLAERLCGEHAMTPEAAAELIDLLTRQRAATGCGLPHRRHLLVERVADPATHAETGRTAMILHTFWGGRVNRPLAIALAAAWEERFATPLEIDSDDDCLILSLPRALATTGVNEILELVRPDRIEDLLRRRLETTGYFGARFRENAGRALLLPRSDFRRRVPLWLQRERAKKLLGSVERYGDFPIVVETWRTCLQDGFELEALARVLDELASGEIRVSYATTSTASPFAEGLMWKQTNRLMYEDDVPESRGGALSPTLLKEVVFSSRLRPRLPAELIDVFERKLRRTFSGYAPVSAPELLEWIKERVAIPFDEWEELLAAIARDREKRAPTEIGDDPAGWLAEIESRVVVLQRPSQMVCAVEVLPRLARALGVEPAVFAPKSLSRPDEPAPQEALAALAVLARPPAAEDDEADPLLDLVAQWLRFYGPLEPRRLEAIFGLPPETRARLVEELAEQQSIVVDELQEGAGGVVEICDAENLERLLRRLRARSRPVFEPLPLERLPMFLAHHQGLAGRSEGVAGLQTAIETLLGFAAPARAWESDLLPARLEPYYTAWLDSLFQESDLLWRGAGKEKLALLFPADLDLLPPPEPAPEDDARLDEVFPDDGGRFSFDELLGRSRLGSAALGEALWAWAWAGRVSNTSFLAVRRGLLSKFKPVEAVSGPPATAARRARSGRRRFDRWRSSRPFAGEWHRLPAPLESDGETSLDAIDREELNKERARLLLDRYGVVFRELLDREPAELGWRPMFRTLRLMELSGEVLSGYFFRGVPGPQFASQSAYRRLSEGLPEDAIFWMSAADPASPCGLGLDDLRGRLPARLPSNHLVYHGARLVITSRRHGGELEIRVGPDHPHFDEYLGFLKVFLTRQFAPVKAIDVETINGEPAATGRYASRLRELFQVSRVRSGLRLRRRY